MSTQEQANEMSTIELARAVANAPRNGRAPIDEFTGPRTHGTPGIPVATGAVVPSPFHPSPSLDPGNVKAIEGYAEFEGYLSPALNAFSVAFEGLKAIDAARQQVKRNRALTPELQLLQVAGAAEKKHEQMGKAFDTARSNLIKAADALEQSLSAPLEAQAQTGFGAEIRAHVKNMPREERSKFIAQAMERSDVKVLTSVLGAPSFLSGLSEIESQHYTRAYREKSAPEATRRLTATRAAVALIERNAPLIHTQVEKALGGTWKQVAELRGMADASAKALAAITG